MHWKNVRLRNAASDFFFLLGSLFLSTWPNILGNWISDISGRLLGIDTTVGTWAVIAAAVASILMAFVYRRRTNPDGPYNTPAASNSNSKYILMQGGMFSLAIIFAQACQGIYSGPLTDDKVLSAIIALIPALEGALGAQFMHVANNQAVYYLDSAMQQLVSTNPRVSERMIVEQAKAMTYPANPFGSLSEQELSALVRARMVYFATGDTSSRFATTKQKIVIDTLSNPKSWRIGKAEAEPVRAGPASTTHATQGDTQQTELEQRRLWERWRANPGDFEALQGLFYQTYHTTHGLVAAIKFEVSQLINHILKRVVDEHRKLSADEEKTVMILRRILGEAE